MQSQHDTVAAGRTQTHGRLVKKWTDNIREDLISVVLTPEDDSDVAEQRTLGRERLSADEQVFITQYGKDANYMCNKLVE